MIKNKVIILGLGYVGRPLAKAITENTKYDVHGYDLIRKSIRNVKIAKNTKAIKNSNYIIVCVPTPINKDNLPDLKPLKTVTNSIKEFLEKGQRIIIESTVNPGVCEEVILPILESTGLKGGKDFELSHCPERINPGDKKWNVKNIPRNIGSLTQKGNKEVADFYRSFLNAEINEMKNIKEAEATKVIENTFRDINIAYVNELAQSFDMMGIDLIEVIKGASNKPFSFMAHYPSCGVGGHCIPVDPYYLINRAKKAGFNHKFLKRAREINNSMPAYTVKLMENKLENAKLDKKTAKILLLGLAYKANVEDMRESPSLKIIEVLKGKEYNFKIFDPHFPAKNTTTSLEAGLKWANTIILATNHKEFKPLKAPKLKENNISLVIDGKNWLDKDAITKADIIYKGIGR